MVRTTIIGVDPGTTTGLAILDTSGNILAVFSKRDMGVNDTIKFITKFGQPLIVASDVNPLPRTVGKIARKVNAKIYFPKQSLHVIEKQNLIKEFADIVKDEHGVDALAASIKAWKKYKSFFSSIENELSKHGLSEFFGDVAKKLLDGKYDNIEEAMERIKQNQLEEINPEIENKEMIQKLHRTLAKKDKYIEALTRQIDFLNKSLSDVKKKLSSSENKTDYSQKKDLEKIEKANRLLKKIIEIEDMNLIPLIEIEDKSVKEINGMVDLEDKFLFTDSLENLYLLNQYKIKSLLTTVDVDKKIVKDLEFPIVQVKEVFIQNIIDGIKAIKPEHLEKELKKAKKVGLIEWLEKYRKRSL